MQFELTRALIDDILFSMEDQNGEFYVDTRDGVVAGGPDFDLEDPDEDDPEEDRYIDLPEWDSSDGFSLMEHFAASFKNPLVREELSTALNRGRGVFRAFKDVLGQYPETEKAWFAYKEREMKRRIISWYNALREEWGLEKIGTEPEETMDLLLEDFRFRGVETPAPGSLAFCAESSGGDFAGSISARRDGNDFHIEILEVKPEYRGLGIGEALLKYFLDNIDTAKASVYIDLPANAEGFARVLAREKFKPCMTRYRLTPENQKG